MLVPCQACGRACQGCVDGCGRGCRSFGPCCRSIADCVASACGRLDTLLCPRDRPKPLFTVFAAIMSTVVLAMAVKGVAADGDGCDTQDKYLYVAIAGAVANVFFACYTYKRFGMMMQRQREKEQAAPVRQKTGVEKCLCGCCFTACDRCGIACELFCYDFGIFLYLLFLGGAIAWTVLAGKHLEDDGPCSDKSDALKDCRILWWVFLGVGMCIVCISITCELSREPDAQNPGLQIAPGQYPQHGLLQHQQPTPQVYPGAPPAQTLE
eukprot:TRINITY_DN14934_c0_g1_i1.p2 TRINITY_DN14934_c0_g1~~TRINITY_DN14934_c0_g1_i1.p2  ORF type:complete len:267 (+),score=69.50 TRINITY_DN14934_c0_g1_i1:47-847(+)